MCVLCVLLQRLVMKLNSQSEVVAMGSTITHNGQKLTLTAGQGWASAKAGECSPYTDNTDVAIYCLFSVISIVHTINPSNIFHGSLAIIAYHNVKMVYFLLCYRFSFLSSISCLTFILILIVYQYNNSFLRTIV